MGEVKRDSGPPSSGVSIKERVVRRKLSELSLLTPEFRLRWYEERDRHVDAAPTPEVAQAVAAAFEAALGVAHGYIDEKMNGPMLTGYYAIGAALGISESQAYAMRYELPIAVDPNRSPHALEADLEAWVERRIAPAGAPRRVRSQPPSGGTRWTGKRKP